MLDRSAQPDDVGIRKLDLCCFALHLILALPCSGLPHDMMVFLLAVLNLEFARLWRSFRNFRNFRTGKRGDDM